MGGLQGLKAHPWFADYDWSKIESKEAIPPFAPDVSFLAAFYSSLQSF
jgi:serine/threonine kinase 32